VVTIDRLVHQEGYTLRGARQAIETGQGKKPLAAARPAAPAPTALGADIIPQLQAIRATLAKALAAS
jgi:hypothetical protein